MPVNPKIKEKLDEKYALGEITKEEYYERLEVLEKSSSKSQESKSYDEFQPDSLDEAPTVHQKGSDLSNAPTIISPDGVEHFVGESDVERNTEEFINRYEFQSNIGAGGMGEVSLYKDIKLNRLVAVKRLRKETTGFSEQRGRARLPGRLPWLSSLLACWTVKTWLWPLSYAICLDNILLI